MLLSEKIINNKREIRKNDVWVFILQRFPPPYADEGTIPMRGVPHNSILVAATKAKWLILRFFLFSIRMGYMKLNSNIRNIDLHGGYLLTILPIHHFTPDISHVIHIRNASKK